MKITDYPKTLELLKREIRAIEQIKPSHGGFMVALNKVRASQDLNPINLDELVLATLGRIEGKIDEKAQVRPEEGSENSNEQEDSSQTSETTH